MPSFFNLPFGVRIAGDAPIDGDRYIASGTTARDALIGSGREFNGLQVYVESDQALYILKDKSIPTWEILASSESGSGSPFSGNPIFGSTMPISGGSVATGTFSNAEGYQTTASGDYGSHAEGYNTIASGYGSHAEGESTTASGDYSHAEGSLTTASGDWSHSEGLQTLAEGSRSHAEGQGTTASGSRSHAEGINTTASGNGSHAGGNGTVASDTNSRATGSNSDATAEGAHSEGNFTTASGFFSHAEGGSTRASGQYAHSEGRQTSAGGNFSHAEGNNSTASGEASFIHSSGSTVLSENGVILGGQQHNMVTAAKRSVILGGSGITANQPDTVYGVDFNASGGISASTIYSGSTDLSDLFGGGVNVFNSNGTLTSDRAIFGDDDYGFTVGYPTSRVRQFGASSNDGMFFNNVATGTTGIGGYIDFTTTSTDAPYLTNGGLFFNAFPHKSGDSGSVNATAGSNGDLDYYGVSVKNGIGSVSFNAFAGYPEIYSSDTRASMVLRGEVTGSSASRFAITHKETYSSSTTYQGFYIYNNGNSNSGLTFWDNHTGRGLKFWNRTDDEANVSWETDNNNIPSIGLIKENLSSASPFSGNPVTGSIVALSGNNTSTGSFSFASGSGTTASGGYGSHATGWNTEALGSTSHAAGYNTISSGFASFAEGWNTLASGYASHTEGYNNTASAQASHAEGQNTTASQTSAHAEGESTIASGLRSHAEGNQTTASSAAAHSEGNSTTASQTAAHAEGSSTTASAASAHAEGGNTIASGLFSHAEGFSTSATSTSSHSEGQSTIASGQQSHAEGQGTTASGDYSHAQGLSTTASGSYSHAEGSKTVALGNGSHSEGYGTTASYISHAEGVYTIAAGDFSHAEGIYTTASGVRSHSEGSDTTASGDRSHSEGSGSVASGSNSHAEGGSSTASGLASHSEGQSTTASGARSHTEGFNTTALGSSSHAGGRNTIAVGNNSKVSGIDTVVSGNSSFSHSSGSTVESDNSAIIVGALNRLTASAEGSIILGGTGITGSTPNTVYGVNFDALGNISGNTFFSGSTNLGDLISSGTNIYNSNGTISGDREILIGNNDLTIGKDVDLFSFDNASKFMIQKSGFNLATQSDTTGDANDVVTSRIQTTTSSVALFHTSLVDGATVLRVDDEISFWNSRNNKGAKYNVPGDYSGITWSSDNDYIPSIGLIKDNLGDGSSKYDKTGGTISGNVSIAGDLEILGTATTINTETIRSLDNNIELNYSGTHISAIGGGFTLISGQTDGTESTFLSDAVGDWNSNVGIGGVRISGNTLYSGSTDLSNILADQAFTGLSNGNGTTWNTGTTSVDWGGGLSGDTVISGDYDVTITTGNADDYSELLMRNGTNPFVELRAEDISSGQLGRFRVRDRDMFFISSDDDFSTEMTFDPEFFELLTIDNVGGTDMSFVGETGEGFYFSDITAGKGLKYNDRTEDEANISWSMDEDHIPSIGMIKDNVSILNLSNVIAGSSLSASTTDQVIAINIASGVTYSLPSNAVSGQTFTIKDASGNAATNNITINVVGGGVNIDGSSEEVLINNYESARYIFDGTQYLNI